MSKVRQTLSPRTSTEIDEPPVGTKKLIKLAPSEEQPLGLDPIW